MPEVIAGHEPALAANPADLYQGCRCGAPANEGIPAGYGAERPGHWGTPCASCRRDRLSRPPVAAGLPQRAYVGDVLELRHSFVRVEQLIHVAAPVQQDINRLAVKVRSRASIISSAIRKETIRASGIPPARRDKRPTRLTGARNGSDPRPWATGPRSRKIQVPEFKGSSQHCW